MSTEPRPKKLLERVDDAIRLMHYSPHTGETYAHWIKRFIFFHDKRHPKEMGAAEVQAFLTYLAMNQNVAASTQNQALSALLFLYRHVLHQSLDLKVDAVRARKSERLPTVLSKDEIRRILDKMPSGQRPTPALAAQAQVWRSFSCRPINDTVVPPRYPVPPAMAHPPDPGRAIGTPSSSFGLSRTRPPLAPAVGVVAVRRAGR